MRIKKVKFMIVGAGGGYTSNMVALYKGSVAQYHARYNDYGYVLESGSGENGYYTKFKDGTLICTLTKTSDLTPNIASGAIFKSASGEQWTFPHNFYHVPSVNVTSMLDNRWAILQGSPNGASCTYGLLSAVTSLQKEAYHLWL